MENTKKFYIDGVAHYIFYNEPITQELLIKFGFEEYLTNQYKLKIGFDLTGTHLQFYSKHCDSILMSVNDPKNDYNLIKPIREAGRFLDLYFNIIGSNLNVSTKEAIDADFEDQYHTIEMQITEHIMCEFSQNYDKFYAHVNKCLNELGLNERFRKDYLAVEEYKSGMRKRYQHKVDSLREQFPNGCFTKNKHGEFVGIDIMLAKMIKELCEIETLKKTIIYG